MRLFKQPKPILGCIHLKPLPGSPLYEGKISAIYEQALGECAIYQEQGLDGIIIENFGDKPFFPDAVPAQTIAAMAAIGREIRQHTKMPIGINVLRNDAAAALSIAHAIEAEFIRVNIHMHAVMCDQGVITGKGFETLRLKKLLDSAVQIWADVQVKHAVPLAPIDLAQETEDLCERGIVDALIVSGAATGKPTSLHDLTSLQKLSTVPVMIGSGTKPDNLSELFSQANGFIVGSYFKKDGICHNNVDPQRVAKFMATVKELRQKDIS